MRLIGRTDDLLLLGGLTVALLVIMSPVLTRVMQIIQDFDQGQGIRLLQALVIITSVFGFHQVRKRHEMHAEAEAAAAVARHATERAGEMERLVAFGQGLARSLDEESIQQATIAHLPLLAPGRGAWVMLRVASHWKPLTTIGDSSPEERERSAAKALGELDPEVGELISDACFPLIVGGLPMGVLGVAANPPVTEQHRRILTAAASLLAVSLKNAELFREVHENSVRDLLTGCFNRGYALEAIDAELRRSRRSTLPLSMVMFDIDHFKRINDQFGHMGGDAVLAAVGARMRAVLRGSDLKFRMGGEEFLVLLPDTPLTGARRVAESLRRELAEHPVQWNERTIPVTASFGVTTITPGELDAVAIMARADGALYRAKEEGRNCVRVVDQPEPVAAVR
jgi:diguanylate cyclase (GGDEF)-like protein